MPLPMGHMPRRWLVLVLIITVLLLLSFMQSTSTRGRPTYITQSSYQQTGPPGSEHLDPHILDELKGAHILSEQSLALPIPPSVPIPSSNYTSVLVVSKPYDDSVAWLHEKVPDLRRLVYEIDRPDAQLPLSTNHGREASAYLTYIIEFYDLLPEVVFFIQAALRPELNNAVLDRDVAETINRISYDRIIRQGYMNLRCDHQPGCPTWIRFDRSEADRDRDRKPEEYEFTPKIWRSLFDPDDIIYSDGRLSPVIPNSLSAPLGAQFAVSRERILMRPRDFYVHLLRWLRTTSTHTDITAKMFAVLWQYIFTGHPDYCPAQSACYCDGYGACFGSESNVQDWLDKYAERDRLIEKLKKELQEVEAERKRQQAEKENARRRKKNGKREEGGDGTVGTDPPSEVGDKDGSEGREKAKRAPMDTLPHPSTPGQIGMAVRIRMLTKELAQSKKAAFEAGLDPWKRQRETETVVPDF